MTEVFLFDSNLTIGQKVRIFRVARRWTQEDLAFEAGVPQGIVSAMERDLPLYPSAKQAILQTCGLLSELEGASDEL